MLNWLSETLTLARLLAFVLGMIVSQVVGWYINRRRMKAGKPCKSSGMNTVVGVVVILAMIWIMVATQQGRNCALTVNRSVSESQRIDTIDNDSFQNAIKESLPYQNLPDAERREATKDITARYIAVQAEVAKLRKANQANQAAASKACGVK